MQDSYKVERPECQRDPLAFRILLSSRQLLVAFDKQSMSDHTWSCSNLSPNQGTGQRRRSRLGSGVRLRQGWRQQAPVDRLECNRDIVVASSLFRNKPIVRGTSFRRTLDGSRGSDRVVRGPRGHILHDPVATLARRARTAPIIGSTLGADQPPCVNSPLVVLVGTRACSTPSSVT